MNKDVEILRGLAQKVREIANRESMQTLIEKWKRHNSLKGTSPMICVSPEGSWREILPEAALQCSDKLFRTVEFDLRAKIFWAEKLKDDTPISANINIPWDITLGSYGMDVEMDTTESETGSFRYKEPIKNIDDDFHKLRRREISLNRESTRQKVEMIGNAVGDILNVRIRGTHWWTLGLTSEAIKLVGLTNLMMMMYDNPEGLHKLMAFLRDEHLSYIQYLKTNDLLCLNNEDDLIASGGIGYTNELPAPGFDGRVRFRDMWGFAESQETVGISPDMFSEFVFPYQLALLENFGINCYGCCEPIEGRWEDVSKIPRLRRISVSPWSNQLTMRDYLGKNYIFSRKPNPSFVCAGFDEQAIRDDLSLTMSIAKDTNMEIILKDTHTVQNEPQRLSKWVEIAREMYEKVS